MKISINNFTFYCIIGILDFEKKKEQKVVIDLCFKYKYKNPSSFVDYSKIVKDIENIMKEKRFELIEEAIIYLKKYLKDNYPIKKVKLKISKPNILNNCIVSIKNN